MEGDIRYIISTYVTITIYPMYNFYMLIKEKSKKK
jgi:hypothetical protein